jgi:hypothetical protein
MADPGYSLLKQGQASTIFIEGMIHILEYD